MTWTTVDRDADGRALRQVAEIQFRRKEWRNLPVRVLAVLTLEREGGKQLFLLEGLDFTVQT